MLLAAGGAFVPCDDENGYCVRKFRPNKHLRVIAPKSWKDLFRKYPAGHGMLTKDRVYYNRRKKQGIQKH